MALACMLTLDAQTYIWA